MNSVDGQIGSPVRARFSDHGAGTKRQEHPSKAGRKLAATSVYNLREGTLRVTRKFWRCSRVGWSGMSIKLSRLIEGTVDAGGGEEQKRVWRNREQDTLRGFYRWASSGWVEICPRAFEEGFSTTTQHDREHPLGKRGWSRSQRGRPPR